MEGVQDGESESVQTTDSGNDNSSGENLDNGNPNNPDEKSDDEAPDPKRVKGELFNPTNAEAIPSHVDMEDDL